MPSPSTSTPEVVLAFDLYGTLLDTASIKDALGQQFGKYKGAPLATLWRRFQLEYTWRLNSMKQYRPLSSLTRDALIQALDDYPQSWDERQIDAVMAQYTKMSAFPDVPEALQALATLPVNVKPVIFSNGTEESVQKALTECTDLAPHAAVFKKIVSVDGVKKYKPDPEVYYHLAESMGIKGRTKEDMSKMWLISGNSFDVVGARAVGMKTVWIRSGQVMAWTDKIVEGEEGKPEMEASSVKDAVAMIGGRLEVKT